MNINNTMNQYKALSLILLMMAYKVSAESIVYITDEVDIPIRTNKSTKSEIIRLMPTGSELSILQSTEDGWTQIKMGDSFGWILTAFVSSSPPARDQLKKLARTYNANKLLISKLASEKEVLENQFLSAKEENTALLIQSSKSQAEKEHIEEIYQDALKLEHENEKLIQESLQLKAELQLAENNTQIQRDSSSRNWFFVGAIVLFFGMIIGFILPGFFNRRRY